MTMTYITLQEISITLNTNINTENVIDLDLKLIQTGFNCLLNKYKYYTLKINF